MLENNVSFLILIGYDTLPSFNEEFSVNHFYGIVASRLTSLNSEYLLHIVSYNQDGITSNEWITFDLSSSNTNTAVMELHSYILNAIDKCNKMNKDIVSSIIFEDGK